MCNEPRPNGEDDPCLLHPGRSFRVNWLFGNHVHDAGAVVYEVYEASATHPRRAATHPVYVGIAESFTARWSSHRSKSWWFDRVNVMCVLLAGYPSREDARKVEAELIAEHRPAYNTKPERRHLALARELPPREYLFLAELEHLAGAHGS